jgi:hypothetical protein
MTNKKISINRKNFAYSLPDGSYKIRYRVLSNDKTQYSDWSEYIKIVPPSSIKQLLGTIFPVYSYNSPILTVSVNFAATQQIIVQSFDVYVSWYIGSSWQPWKWATTILWTNNSSLPTINLTKDTGATKGRIAMVASTYPLLTSSQISAMTTTGNPGNMNYVFVDTTGYSTP